MSDPLTPTAIARDLLRMTLHGPPPLVTTMRLAEAVVAMDGEIVRLRAALSWQDSRHGTQADQEREEAEAAAELAAIDAMSDEEVEAGLREAGVDVDAGRETCAALVRVAMERNRLHVALAEAEATILNERGEGEPPSKGWKATLDEDSDTGHHDWTFRRSFRVWWYDGSWAWGRPYLGNGWRSDSSETYKTARAAMKAADTVRTAGGKGPA